MEWIKVTDRLPITQTPDVLICLNDGTILMGNYMNGQWLAFWSDKGFDTVAPSGRKVTHWMPLPEPPKD